MVYGLEHLHSKHKFMDSDPDKDHWWWTSNYNCSWVPIE